MRDLLPQDVVGRQPNGVKIACLLQPRIDRGDRVGGVSAEEAAPKVAASVADNHRVEDVPPAVSAVDVAIAQGAAFQHAELVEQEVRMIAGAVEVSVPDCALLFAMGWADGAVHVQHDVFEPVAIMEAVDPLPVQVGQGFPVLGQGQRLGLKPPHLRCRGCLRTNSPAAHDLTHDRIEGQPIGVVDIFIPRQPSINRLPEKPVKPVDGVLASADVAQRTPSKLRQPERVIQLAHHQEPTVRTELRATKFQPHTRVEIHPTCPLRARTLWVIHETGPSQPSTP